MVAPALAALAEATTAVDKRRRDKSRGLVDGLLACAKQREAAALREAGGSAGGVGGGRVRPVSAAAAVDVDNLGIATGPWKVSLITVSMEGGRDTEQSVITNCEHESYHVSSHIISQRALP